MLKKIFCFFSVLLVSSCVYAEYKIGPTSPDLDEFGGYIHLKTQGNRYYEEFTSPDYVGETIIEKQNAFGALVPVWEEWKMLVQFDSGDWPLYSIIDRITDDYIFTKPCDRLDWPVNNLIGLDTNDGSMEDDDSSWADLATPTANEQSSTQYARGSYSRHVTGNGTGDGIQQTGLAIDAVDADCSTDHDDPRWNDEYEILGSIYKVSGTVKVKIIDGDGSTIALDTEIGTADKWRNFHYRFTTNQKSSCGSGTVQLYCSGGPCEFYVDDVILGEFNYMGDQYVTGYNRFYGMNNYNDGTEPFRTLGQWRTELIGNNWWFIDPMDNVWIFKGMNKFIMATLGGHDFDMVGASDNFGKKYGDSGGENTLKRMKYLSEAGFNATFIDVYGKTFQPNLDYTKYPLMVHLSQARQKIWSEDDAGFIDFPGTWEDGQWSDYFDPDYESIVCSYPDGRAFNGPWSFRVAEGAIEFHGIFYNLYPINWYRDESYHAVADPWFLGSIWQEEARGSYSFGHLGLGLFCTPVDGGTSASDGVCESKIASLNQLRAKYTDGGEETFISRIDFEGANEITRVSNWSTIPEYDSTDTDADGTPDKDEAAITNLNTAWGTTFPTEVDVSTNAWEFLEAYTCSNNDYGIETAAGNGKLCNNIGNAECALLDGDTYDAEFVADMEDINTNWLRKTNKIFYDVLNGPDGLWHGTKFLPGPGTSRVPFIRAMTGIDGTNYQTSAYINALQATGGSIYLPTQNFENEIISTGGDYLDGVLFSGSNWCTGESTAPQGWFRGNVDAVYNLLDAATGSNQAAYAIDIIDWFDKVYLYDGTTYNDITDETDNDGSDFSIIDNAGEYLYIGLERTQFSSLQFGYLSEESVGAGYSLIAEYSTDSGWDSLSTTDMTENFEKINVTQRIDWDETTNTFTNIGIKGRCYGVCEDEGGVDHWLVNGDRVILRGQLPSELNDYTEYYVVNATTKTFQVSETLGGGPVNFSAPGDYAFPLAWKMAAIISWTPPGDWAKTEVNSDGVERYYIRISTRDIPTKISKFQYILNGSVNIQDGTAVTWNNGASSGEILWQHRPHFQIIPNNDPERITWHQARAILLVDNDGAGSFYPIDVNDVITDGTNSYELHAVKHHGWEISSDTPIRVSVFYDEDGNFDTNGNSPRALSDNYDHLTFFIPDDVGPTDACYMRPQGSFVWEKGFALYQSLGNGCGANYNTPGRTGNTEAGDYYRASLIWEVDTDHNNIPWWESQSERAAVYLKSLRDNFNLDDSNGINHFAGFANYGMWDYGFPSYYQGELRNFGWFTQKDNAYDGVEATTLGADGVAGTWDDEVGDFGDFVGPMRLYLNKLMYEERDAPYVPPDEPDEVRTGIKLDGTKLDGVTIIK